MNSGFFVRSLINIIVATSLHPRALARDSVSLAGNPAATQNIPCRKTTLGLQVKNFSIEFDQVYETVIITWKI
jgi:hypothetical protein